MGNSSGVLSKENSNRGSLSEPCYIVTTDDEEDIPILERESLDKIISKRMTWKAGGIATVVFTAKLHILAERAQKAIQNKSIKTDPINEKSPTSSGIKYSNGGKTRGGTNNKWHNNLKEGRSILTERLNFMSLKEVTMIGDGNCQFRSFSNELYGVQDHHMKIRIKAVNWMATYSEEYSVYIGDENEWNLYLKSMVKSTTWGDELTLRAVCDCYGIVVHLITTEKENWHLEYNPKSQPKIPIRHAFLAYISPVHYNTVELINNFEHDTEDGNS